MTVKLLMGLATAGLVSATSTVTSMFLTGLDAQNLVASIIGNDATATTYYVTCPPSTSSEDDYDCGLGPGLTVTEAAPTHIMELNEKPDFYYTVSCSVGGTTAAVCTEIAGGPEANFPGTTISTLRQSEIGFVPVTITAGSITSVSATATPTTTAESGSKTTGGPTETSKSSTSSSASGSSSSSSSSSSATSTGGMPQITGDASMLFGGAAVALAAALL
ncbi:Mucin-21 [Aspergillus hancockii]|nr:Mucin-21 [Aspergillus hancockii]